MRMEKHKSKKDGSEETKKERRLYDILNTKNRIKEPVNLYNLEYHTNNYTTYKYRAKLKTNTIIKSNIKTTPVKQYYYTDYIQFALVSLWFIFIIYLFFSINL